MTLRDERAANRAPERTTPCMVTVRARERALQDCLKALRMSRGRIGEEDAREER